MQGHGPKSKIDLGALNNASEHDIWEALRRGDSKTAITIMDRRYGNLVLKTCYGFLHNQVDAADSKQAVFEKAFKRIDTLIPGTWPGAWLKMIATNHCRDVLKKRRRAPRIDMVNVLPDEPDPALLSDEALSVRELADMTLGCLDNLSQESRQALMLRMTEDISYAEMSERLSSPPAALQMRVTRAVFALIRCLEAKGVEI